MNGGHRSLASDMAEDQAHHGIHEIIGHAQSHSSAVDYHSAQAQAVHCQMPDDNDPGEHHSPVHALPSCQALLYSTPSSTVTTTSQPMLYRQLSHCTLMPCTVLQVMCLFLRASMLAPWQQQPEPSIQGASQSTLHSGRAQAQMLLQKGQTHRITSLQLQVTARPARMARGTSKRGIGTGQRCAAGAIGCYVLPDIATICSPGHEFLLLGRQHHRHNFQREESRGILRLTYACTGVDESAWGRVSRSTGLDRREAHCHSGGHEEHQPGLHAAVGSCRARAGLDQSIEDRWYGQK